MRGHFADNLSISTIAARRLIKPPSTESRAMSLKLYAHPFSSYCQKVLIALYENDIPFEWRMLSGEHPDIYAEFAALWPFRRFPLLMDGERPVMESTVIIEHLALHHPGPVSLLPADASDALEVRFLDRFFDLYVSTPQQKIVFDALRAQAERDARGVRDAREALDTAYAWLDNMLAGREWAAGSDFSLADCSAAPSLFYADWTHRIDSSFGNLIAYRKRLLARPSFARAVDEARPYRPLFPLGAPDRD
jgi:glutathione S-transferase